MSGTSSVASFFSHSSFSSVLFLYLLLHLLRPHIWPTEAAPRSLIRSDYSEPMAKPSVPVLSPTELQALYQVMGAIVGDAGSWRAHHPMAPCTQDSWPGVVCEEVKNNNNDSDMDDDGYGDHGKGHIGDESSIRPTIVHVTRLELGYKPNLTCAPNATLHPAIAKLAFLQSLFIFGCFTEGNASIPPVLGLLAGSLRELSLRSNPALVGSIPSELGELSSLQVLSLSQNSLYGEIPPSFGRLRNLQHLDLSYNMLSGAVPPELGAMESLVIMDLSMNALVGHIPPSLGRLTLVQKLDMSSNALEGKVPMELGNLNNLRFLSLSGNAITGPLPASMANFSESLQYLLLDSNPIKGPIPGFLGQFSNILALSLSNCGYSGSIPQNFVFLTNLTVLSLDRNNLTGPIPSGFAELPHLYSLNLSQNRLSGPIPFTPTFVRRLGKNLDLQGNSELCARWALPQNKTTGEIMKLCSELNGSADSSVHPSSYWPRSPRALYSKLLVAALITLLINLLDGAMSPINDEEKSLI
ncbi:hypothetical protein KP509_36G021700 [Ceratopteris richardii]|uniref:Disease resistance R13L4/SHOC-2-like LRR domain-containing protein n=1 Tax=Ceratopteris richardii TaxID=49495 RepID=A0A8T2QBR3_CERRI|nr:hypothetical protein KP509_36G021700 [Ceratopteris richardii]